VSVLLSTNLHKPNTLYLIPYFLFHPQIAQIAQIKKNGTRILRQCSAQVTRIRLIFTDSLVRILLLDTDLRRLLMFFICDYLLHPCHPCAIKLFSSTNCTNFHKRQNAERRMPNAEPRTQNHLVLLIYKNLTFICIIIIV
jgi:hypothetical protein